MLRELTVCKSCSESRAEKTFRKSKLRNWYYTLLDIERQAIYKRAVCEQGQSTVEYAIIFAAFLALVIALGALWNLFDSGLVVDHALQSASHHLQEVAQGAWLDVFLY